MISPIDPRRTISNRRGVNEAAFSSGAVGGFCMSKTSGSDSRMDYLGGRMIFGIAHDFYATTALHDNIALGHGVGGVVCSFCVNVGTDFADQRSHVTLGED